MRYEYDDLYRLISEEVVGGDTTTYTYDDVGNRLSKTVNGTITNTYTYDDNDLLKVEIAGGDTIEYKYDKNGNLTERKENDVVTATYVWDDQNRMVQAQTDAGTVTYKYDDDNIRVSETVGGTTKSYVLDKNRPYAQVLAEYEDGNLDASYTYGLDLIEQERDGNESYYSVDGLGSTRGLTDENGTVTDTYTYDAYGEGVSEVGDTENDYRFAGEQFDGTLGQYYLRQRYYDPSSGRFTRRDTYEGNNLDPVSLHKYIYANADPVNGIDPSGFATLAEINASSSISEQLDAVNTASVTTTTQTVSTNLLKSGALAPETIQAMVSKGLLTRSSPAVQKVIQATIQASDDVLIRAWTNGAKGAQQHFFQRMISQPSRFVEVARRLGQPAFKYSAEGFKKFTTLAQELAKTPVGRSSFGQVFRKNGTTFVRTKIVNGNSTLLGHLDEGVQIVTKGGKLKTFRDASGQVLKSL
ncbi:RHS repeat-associated core domain-containing protein [Lusitaniella coriacea LEGE 07157]|uniref:RHS repeat-associated core domain-containing protein n=1 Tax=Lusitaniella coriacea LEGE 07157 TaxID=945747 RepID=A0A8J7E0L2_9CYAN|nr:RHS repeat-associated core domain-containing protein [Lusitaniella coriacea]MBE9118291.1 RHS repeat-associated core domain-containing protein [Lusitaniella coriacea LEGE 07157]